MAFSSIASACVQGLHIEVIHAESDVSNGLPMFHMVGYLSSEVKEASERGRTAIRNSGMKLPAKKIIVNLAPATVRKKGASFDLPIALAVLAAMGYIPEEAMERVIVTGELSLEGKIRGVPGVLPMVIEAKEQGCKSFILPGENETEGRLVKGIEILPADNLEELCAYLNGAARSEKSKREKKENEKNKQHRTREDFADICGQKAVKRAAEIALSYEHTRPNGQNPFTIYTEENITRLDTGENIAVASPNVYSKAEAVNDGWREDNEPYAGQGHRRNMLGYKFTCVGVGHVTYNGYDYWVEEFASRPSINTTETPANDNEQTVTVSVAKSWITNYKTYFDQNSYVLRLGETVTPNITHIISLINQFGAVGTVVDTPTVSINDPSIATYSDGKIIGLKEGTTTLTTSLYGLPSTTSATIIVHDCDNHWDGGVITKVPTCIVEGERTYTCTICNNTKVEKIGIDATNHLHSEIRNQKEASCKEEGYTGDKYCPDCGTKLSSGNTIAKTENHNWNKGVITKKPTCAETGVKTYTCSICSKTKTENIAKTPKHLHTEIRNKKAAT